MAKLFRMRFAVAAFLLLAVMEATNPAHSQNLNDLLSIFRGDKQRAARQARAEWHRVRPAEVACIDQRLRREGSRVEALIRRGVKPSASRLIELRSSCREFVGGVQTDTAPALARDAIGSPTPTVPPNNPVEAKDAGVASSAESLKEPSVTLPPTEKTIGQVAEEQMQQGGVESKSSVQERGIVGWLSAAFLFALLAIATLVCIVIYLFIRWRNAGQRTVAVSLPEKNSGGAGNTPLETTRAAGEAVKPLADKMIQQSNQTRAAAATSMTQESAGSNNIQATYGEVIPEIASIEGSESNSPDNTAVENVALLAKLCARGTPSEKDFQRIKGLISVPSGNAQERQM